MTNKPMLSVERDVIESALECLERCQDQAFQSCECEECLECGKMPDGCSGTECAKTCQCSTCEHCCNEQAMKELGALLDNPVVESEFEPDAVCTESDGCPTEGAVLKRFWRENQPDTELCKFYEAEDCQSLVKELVGHVAQLQDAAKRNVKPWEDTFPPTLLPAYIARINAEQTAPAVVVMPDNLVSHRNSWLQAMERLVALEAEATPATHDSDEAGYWEHELKAMRAMYADLDRLNGVKP